MVDLLINSLSNAFRARLRALFTILAISIGIVSVVLISSIGRISSTLIARELDRIGINGLTVFPNGSSPLYPEDSQNIQKELAGVEYAMPLMTMMGTCKKGAARNDAIVWGVDHNLQRFISNQLLHGRFPNASDISGGRSVAVLDEGLAKKLYKRDNIIGKEIVLNTGGADRKFTVIGVIGAQSQILGMIMGESAPSFVYVPHTALSAMTHKSEITQIVIKYREGSDVDKLSAAIARILNRKYPGAQGYSIENMSGYRDSFASILDTVTACLSAVGAISMIVAGIGVMNTLLSSVAERTREVGLQKALGAGPGQIAASIVFESICLSVVGGLAGITAGLGVSIAGARYFGLSGAQALDVNIIMLSAAVAGLCGVVFGIAPAYRASRLDPVVALREG